MRNVFTHLFTFTNSLKHFCTGAGRVLVESWYLAGNVLSATPNQGTTHRTSRFPRLDSVSLVSRQSDLCKFVTTLALLLCLGVGRLFAVDYCQSSAFGYGASATGGGAATPVLVNSVSGLQSALNKANGKVIIITSNLTFTKMLTVKDGSNVTLLGLPGVTLTSNQQDKDNSGILYFRRFNNLIIRNLTFVGPGAYDCEGNDLLCFDDVTNAWVDHCDFQDGVDGNFDNKHTTDQVTISWCRFRYLKAPKAGGSGGSDDHRFTNLLGSSSSDKPSDGTYNLTWAYCWWDEGCKERMVRCRNAELHFLNCYWNSSVANYYVGPENAKCYFDGCTFEGKANKSDKIFKSYGGTNACKFVGCTGNTPSNSGTISAPSYSYASYTFANAAAAKTAVTNASCGAGATLTVTTAGVISSTCDGGAPAPTVYTVTWNATDNGGSCGTATTSVTSGNAIGSLPEATKSGFTFDGWYTASSGGTKISSSTTVTGNVTYFAQFTSTPVTTYYTVIWDANGGTCGTASTSVEDGHTIGSVINPLPTATKSDNTFDGWFTSVSGGTQITTSTTISANVTYYAHYTPIGGGGGCETLAQGTQNASHTAIDATIGTISTTGGESQDDYIKLSGSSSQCFVVTAKSGYTIAADDKLTVTVYNKANSAADIGFTINGTAHTENIAAKTEGTVVYTLQSSDISAGTVTIKRNASNDRYGAILLERCGASPTYTLSYDENGGSGSAMSDQNGTSLTVAANTYTAPTGYAFQKWNTAMNGGGTDYSSGNSITLTEDVTLYAIWQPQTYTVSFDKQSGSDGTNSVTATFDAAMPSITVPTRSGYTFAGYYTAANGEGTQYYDGNGSSTNDWTIASNTTLYAKWTEGAAPAPSGCDLHFHFFYATDATNNGLTNDATVFTSMVSDGSSQAGSITIDGTSYSVTRRTGDNATFGNFTIPSGKIGTFYALAVSSGAGDRQINLVRGGTTYELPVEGGSSSYKRLEQGDLPAGTYSIEREGSSNVRLGVVVVKLCDDVACADKYSFHYGTDGQTDWTIECFTKVGDTHEWNITNFAIPNKPNFYVGYEGSNGLHTVEKSWSDTPSERAAGVWNGAMLLLPGTSKVGLATGAVGKLVAWDDSESDNYYVGFQPNGYGITYGGVGHAFNTTATANMWETDVVTLPDVSTTYTMGLATATAGTYVTCAHSSAAEAISNMGVTILNGGKKMIYLEPGSFNTGNAVYAVWDVTNSAWGDGTTKLFTDANSDGVWECPVASSCTSINLVRMSSGTTASNIDWSRKWNQTANISVGDLLNKYTITSLSGDNCAYTTTAMHPATGQKGKFRMWANSASNNWFVHWIPYYVLSYDANGGSGSTAQAERNSESSTLTVTTAASGFTAPTGYEFAGWATTEGRADAGTVDYAAGVSYTLTNNATLYAVWQAKTYTITLNNQSAASGMEGTASVTATYNSNTTLVAPITCPKKNGYFFDGYYTETDGGGTQLIDRNGNFLASKTGYTDASRNWIRDDGVTLYAKWTALTVTLTISPNVIAPSTATNVTYTITTNAPTGTTIPYTFAIFNFGTSEYAGGYLDGDHNINSTLSTTVSINMAAGVWYTRAVIVLGGTELATSDKTQLVAGNLYTVTYDANSGSVDPSSITQASPGASVTLATPTRSGYTFQGWYVGATKIGDAGDSYTPTANVTAVAAWKETCAGGGGTIISYTMTAECKGSDPCVETASGSIGGTAYLYKLAASNDVYKLNNDNASYFALKLSSGYYQSGDVLKLDGSKAMHVYTGNHGSGSELGITSDPSEGEISYTLPNTLPSNTNEIYVYRNNSTYNGTLSYMKVDRTGGTCYYVTYDGNGADGGYTNDPTAYDEDETVTVLANGFTKTGYVFQGWANSTAHRDAGTVDYNPAGTFTITSNVTLYAVWSLPCSTPTAPTAFANTAVTTTTATFSITDAADAASYDLYYASGNPADPTAGTEATTNVTTKTPTIEGLTASTTYKIWVRAVCDASHKSAWVALTGSSFTTLDPPTYTVSYDAHRLSYPSDYTPEIEEANGSVPANANYIEGATVTVPGNTGDLTFIIDGAEATFRGWTNNSIGYSNPYYTAGSTFTMPASNVTLYAVWSFPIEYHLDGGTINDVSYDTYYIYTHNTDDSGITTATLPTNVTKTGYTFAGWHHESNFSDDRCYNIEGFWYGTYHAYAKWTENLYDITYDANTGSGSMSNTHGHYVTIADNTFTKSGYIFNGWNTAADGSGTSYDEGEEIELTANLTLYAQWKEDYTITWGNVQIGGVGATVTPNLGGGNYTITVNTGSWTGSLTADMFSASTGVTITNVAIDNSGSPKTATLTFEVGADVVGSTITLTIDVPADGGYGAKTDDHVISIERCEGTSVVWDFTTNTFLNGGSWSTSAGAENKAYATDGSTILKYYAGGSGDVWNSSNAQLQTHGTTATSSGTSLKQLTQKYFRFPTLSGKGKISVTYGTNKSTLRIYEATSTNIYGLDPVITLTSAEPESSTYSFKSDKTYYMTMESAKVYFKNLTFVSFEGAGVTPTLSWETDLSSGVAKETGDADFTYTASTTSNTLGTITYSSNNTSVVTVNATTGKVHIVGPAGSATITATLAESGCYEEVTVTYTITVTRDCDDVAGTISTTEDGCDVVMTVTGHTAEAGVSYQWYKVGSPDVAVVGATSATYRTYTPGEYYVVVTNTGSRHCDMASTNTIVIEEREGFEISKLIDYWYVKNGRRTPDIELVKTANAGSFTVKVGSTTIWNSDGSVTTGFGGCGFYLGEDGIIYLKGTQDNGDAPSGLTDGTNITIRVTVNQECGVGTSYVDIVIRCQGATTRPSVAFVVDGTKNGAFDAENEDHSVETALYKFLDYGEDSSGAFDLTGQNIYSTTDEKEIREHYSQFDAILVTDDPSTKATPSGDYKTKGYVNAFGTLIDVRPILTMEAYVSALANWNCVKGDPSTPSIRQYEMRLQCKNHEIYGGLPTPSSAPGISNVWNEDIDGDEYRHVIMVDSLLSPYTGVAWNAQTGQNEKPALQGFTLEAMGDLLGLGVISDGTLQAGIERQHEPAARMIILGINAKALPHALTPEGKKVIENTINYLLKTNMEDVDDCSNFFVGGTDGKERDWNTTTNWSKNSLPSYETKVRILAPCEISGGEIGRVAQVEIASSGSSKIRYAKRGNATCDGNLVVAADGALIVEGKIYSAVAPYFNSAKLTSTSPSELRVVADDSHTGALIFDNEDGKAQATVEMWSSSYWEVVAGKKKKWWSYVGVPITNVDIPNYFYLGFTYLYDETSGWIKKWDGSVLQPFEGIGLSMQSGHKETFYGTLASTATKEISLTYTGDGCKGENLIGNSWTAPIQIANFDAADFGGAVATVYVYNSGRDDVYENPTYVVATEDNDGAATAGQWVGVPISVAGLGGYTGLKVVPAMNAFQVNTSSETTLTLDYDKLVRNYDKKTLNTAMRAPRHRNTGVTEVEALMRVRVSGEFTHTDVWLLQDELFTDEFDNGWEAMYAECDNRSAQMYAISELGNMAFLAKPNIDGTVLGFAPSRDGNEYTFSFHYIGDEPWYLNDMQLEESTLINAENTYTFTYSEDDMAGRFVISRQAYGAPPIITGNDNISDEAIPIKFIKDDKIFILVRGVLYDITGKVVK